MTTKKGAASKKARIAKAAVATTIEVTSTTMLDEPTELEAATMRHEDAERETAAVLAQHDKATGRVTQSTSTEVVKPNGQDEKPAEPAKKPVMLTDAAEKIRRGFLEKTHAKVDEVRAGGYNPEAFNAARKEARRVTLIARYQAIEVSFAGRPENSVDADELRQHIESALATLPAEAGGEQFELAALNFVKSRASDIQQTLWELFKGRYNVPLDDVLKKEVEIVLGRDQRRFYGLKVDGEPMNCGFFTDMKSKKECGIRFVPLAWRDHGNWTGHFLIRTIDGTNQKIAYCGRHSSMAHKDGAQMLSSRDADRALGVFKHQEDERTATRANLGSIAKVKIVDGRIVTEGRNDRRDNRKQPGKFDPALAAKCNNPFAALLNNREKDHPVGRYYSPQFEMNDKSTGKLVLTFLDIEVTKYNVVVSNAGPVLADLIDSTHSTGYFENKLLYAALNMAAKAQQK